MSELSERILSELGIELWRIPVVILSSVGIYLGFLLLVRIFGPRVLSRLTIFDAVVVVMFGAVAGRVVLGHPPSLAAGLIGLATLMFMEALFGLARSVSGLRSLLQGGPVVVLANGSYLDEEMRRSHLSRDDINAALRSAGVTAVADVRAVIAEPSGGLSIYRTGQPIDPQLLEGVRGAELLE